MSVACRQDSVNIDDDGTHATDLLPSLLAAEVVSETLSLTALAAFLIDSIVIED
jgi:hypothetical protein